MVKIKRDIWQSSAGLFDSFNHWAGGLAGIVLSGAKKLVTAKEKKQAHRLKEIRIQFIREGRMHAN